MSYESSDVMKGRPAEQLRHLKVVLVRVARAAPYELDLESVLVLDGTTQSVQAGPVEWAEDRAAVTDPVLRVLPDRLVVVDATRKPAYEEIVRASVLDMRPEDLQVEEIPDLDVVDAMENGLDEPDVPAVDLA